MAMDLSFLSSASQLAKSMAGDDNATTYATTFSTPRGNFTFISEDVINKGFSHGGTNYWLPWFLDKNNLSTLGRAGAYVDLADVKASSITSKDTWGNWVKDRLGQSSKGFLIPEGSVPFDSLGIGLDSSGRMGNILGMAMDPNGNLVYRSSGGHGNMYLTSSGEVHDPYVEYKSRFGGVIGKIAEGLYGSGLAQLAPIALAFALPGAGALLAAELGISEAAGTAILNAGVQAIGGKDISAIFQNAVLNQLGGALGAEINSGIDSVLADTGGIGDTLGNIAGKTTAGFVASGGKADPLELLKAGSLGEAVSAAAAELPGYDKLSDASKRAVNNAIAAELQGRNPTAMLLSLAKSAGQTAMATSTNTISEAEAARQQAVLQDQLAQYEATGELPTYAPQDMPISPENLKSYQDTLASRDFKHSLWTPDEEGNYTIVGDDGSTITMNRDGSVYTTDATDYETYLDSIGKQDTQATAGGTQPTQTVGKIGKTQANAIAAAQERTAAREKAGIANYTSAELQALGALIDLMGGQVTPQEAQQEAAGAAGAQTYKPTEGASYLDELGQTPEYYKAIDPETLQMLQQMGIDPAELLARQEAEGGAEDMGEGGEEGADYLEAAGGAGGFRTRAGVKRGLPAGTLGIAGTDVGRAYQAARADQGMGTSRAFKLPIDNYSPQYLEQLAKAGEAALGEQWAPYIGGRKLAASGQPSADMTQSGNTLAYVPSASIGQYKGFTGALAPQLVAMVGKDPELLNDPDYLAAVLGHELSHQPQQDAGQFMRDLGMHPGKVGAESAAMSSDIASAIPYLAEKYGYKGFYDTKANAPLNERLADIGGWQMQNQINLTQDPTFLKQVLNSPERMAVYNAMMPQRGVQLDPSFPPVGQLTLEDFGGMNPPISWAYKNLSPEQFKAMLQKRLAGMFGQ